MRLNSSYQIELDNLATLPLCYRNEAGEWEDNDFTEQNLSDSEIAQALALATSEAKTAFKTNAWSHRSNVRVYGRGADSRGSIKKGGD